MDIEEKLTLLDGRGSDSEYDAVKELSSSLGLEFPGLLLAKYRSSKKWGERLSCVYHASKYAVASQDAYELAIEALKDKSKKVRYQACLLLALAQKPTALKPLEVLLSNQDSSEDAKAAIEAIKLKNHNYFADRDHSGMVKLNVQQYHS
ncbi:HEAT repeat domain-containing protein [Alteromonas sp. AMM-1]|uniref:HEAT repeat domain-containing protein n=1 Tax=Alteromonas sp. AMM-1 TaxID=3394233 RepID=UPI0039A488CB